MRSVATSKDINERVEVVIGGNLGAVISLYATCGTKGSKGKTNPAARFTVGASGKIFK